MFVAAKNLCTQERVYLPANKFVILDNEKKVRRLFQPKDENDFLLRDESYGVIKGSLIERHYLLMIKGSVKELQAQNKRLGDPKRISIAPASVKVKDFPLESQKDSKKKKKTIAANDGAKAQREVEKEVVERFLDAGSKRRETETEGVNLGKTDGKKDKIGSRAQIRSNEKTETDKETSVEKTTKRPPANQPTEKASETENERDNLGKSNVKKGEIEGQAGITNNEKSEKDKETPVVKTTKGPSAKQPTGKTRESNPFDGHCCNSAEELLCLMEKYASLEEENEKLRLAADHSCTLKRMEADLAALKKSHDLTGPHISRPTCGVSVEPEFEGIDIPENKVYIGQGKFIGRHEFLEAEDHASFGLRAGALCEAFWPGEVHLYSKTGGVAKVRRQGDDEAVGKDFEERIQYRRIHPMYHLALKTLLRQMSWGQGVDPRMVVNKDKVSRFLSEHPSEMRRNLKKRSKEWENRDKKARRRKSKNVASLEKHKRTRRIQSASFSDSEENTPSNGQRQSTSRAAKHMKKLPEQEKDIISAEYEEEYNISPEHHSDAMSDEEDKSSNKNVEEQTSPVGSENENVMDTGSE